MNELIKSINPSMARSFQDVSRVLNAWICGNMNACVYQCVCLSHLRDPRMGAFAVKTIVLQPLVLREGAVLLEGAAVLSFAPNTPEQWVCFQTQSTASTLGVTLIKVDCAGGKKERRWKEDEDERL